MPKPAWKLQGNRSASLPKIISFSGREFAVVVAIGLVTGLMDDKIEMLQFATVAHSQALVLLNDFLAFKAGGPLFGDLLETWLEFGGVLAAFLVRKPGAGTIALTINGFCQVFAYGTHDPHLLYGAPGLGADLAFALFRYKRYDMPVVCLAGIASAMFWYPIVWFTHGLYLYPPLFILWDFFARIIGSAVGDGVFPFLLGLAVLNMGGPVRIQLGQEASQIERGSMKRALVAGSLAIALGVLTIVLTYFLPSVSASFLSIGPKIPAGMATMEEYNPGYVLGIVLIFLATAFLGLSRLRSRYQS